ncbi:Ser thr protein phosphatase [Mycena venus]|uniref:Ser thr protein phosphatase n=1 Tax=Mycena venus TaxID=2733690 RepID=A0A8H6XY85_9AGAR|nr:Ser thr protein phosphatase [Mycena venus]
MPTIALPHRTCITSPTRVVQLEYPTDGSGPLPKPQAEGAHWTRFVLLSDTHTQRCDVPDGDVLLHSGDLTQRGTLKELKSTMEWLYALPHRVKIIIAGNHDSVVHREWYDANWQDLFVYRPSDGPEPAEAVLELLKGPQAVAANVVYLEDEEYKFKVRDGGKEWSVYGSPLSPYWGDWAFGYERKDGEALISKIPKTDILLTHGPPRNILDLTIQKERAGCSALAAGLYKLKPKLHVFGHIHEARGAYVHRWKRDSDQLPRAQNAIQLQIDKKPSADEEEEEVWSDSDDESGSELDDGIVLSDPEPEQETQTDDAVEGPEETIFVNAANWPSGPNARRSGMRVKMGGQGFQPIIVDLLE